nr:hypothetical protein [uncultured Blautia sp.]
MEADEIPAQVRYCKARYKKCSEEKKVICGNRIPLNNNMIEQVISNPLSIGDSGFFYESKEIYGA